MGEQSLLDREIKSWKGFPWALRREDLELWNAMIEEVRDYFGEAVKASGKTFVTEPFFMALLLAQQRTIRRLHDELNAIGAEKSHARVKMQTTLD